MKKATTGSEVDIEYEGRLDDGTLFDTNKEALAKKEQIHEEGRTYTALHLIIGEKTVIKGFDNALLGMQAEEEKEVQIPPEEGYGQIRQDLVKEVPKEFFQGKEVHKGQWIMVTMQGQNITTLISEAGPKYLLDFNHPLAGKTLHFKIKLIKIY